MDHGEIGRPEVVAGVDCSARSTPVLQWADTYAQLIDGVLGRLLGSVSQRVVRRSVAPVVVVPSRGAD